MNRKLARSIYIAGITAACVFAENACASAQTQGVAPAAVINYRQRPPYPFDAQRLKRRPEIDGLISAGEWDPLYTVNDGPVNGTFYLNWDDDYLYVAVRTDKPAWTVMDIDCKGDGWLHGNDNLELTLAPITGGGAPPIAARILDASSSRDAPTWAELPDIKSIKLAARVDGAVYTVEMAIPKGLAGLTPKANSQLGFRADFLPAAGAVVSTEPFEPHLLLDLHLVDTAVVAASGITPTLKLQSEQIIPGDEVRADLRLDSANAAANQVKAITWKGSGQSADVLRMIREPVPGAVTGNRPLVLHYRSLVPVNTVPGFYEITAEAELADGRAVSSTKSFQVVEPFTLLTDVSPSTVVSGRDVKIRIGVNIHSMVTGYTRAAIDVAVPSMWSVQGKSKKQFESVRRDSTVHSDFYLELPAVPPVGDYPVVVTITWKQKTWVAHQIVHVTAAAPGARP